MKPRRAFAHACQEKAIAVAISLAAESAIDALDKAVNPKCEARFKTEVAEGYRIAARSQFERIASLARTAARHLKKNLSCNTAEAESVTAIAPHEPKTMRPRLNPSAVVAANPGRALEVAGLGVTV